MDKQIFREIIEATPSQIRELKLTRSFECELITAYIGVLDGYLSGDHQELEYHFSKISNEEDLHWISKLRYETSINVSNNQTASKVLAISQNDDSLYRGEAGFILGMHYMKNGQDANAINAFSNSYSPLCKVGANRKATKSLLNALACKTRISPNKKYIREYESLAEKAKVNGAKSVEAICYHNISKELLHVNAFELALSYTNKAFNLLSEENGTYHYFEVVLNRCHILAKLGRYSEALKDYQIALTSDHPQTKDALSAIKILLDQKRDLESFSHLEPCWVDKLNAHNRNDQKIKPTKTELKFINLIKSEPVTRDFVIKELYGDKLDWESAQNRLRVFVHRFRKKFPDQLIESEDKLVLNSDLTISA